MRKSLHQLLPSGAVFLWAASAAVLLAQDTARSHIVVTAEGKHSAAPAEVRKDEISATVDHKPATIADWVPLRGPQAALQLYILIDDGESTDLGSQFEDLKSFFRAQPSTTQIGLAYLRNGSAQIVEPLTADHERVAKSLRLPLGQPGISASPYIALSELFKKWPAAEARREVLLISSGIDLYFEPGPQNPYLDHAIEDAQKGSVVVHSIYYAGSGHFGHSYWRINWGQNYLSQLGEATGGEAYWQGLQTPVSLSPFLRDLSMRLEHQYLLTFERSGLKAGFQAVRLAVERGEGVSLVTPSRVYVK